MMTKTMMTRGIGIAVLAILAGGAPVLAQGGERTVTIVPGPGYTAGSLERAILGDNWRELWLTPVRAPVLDLGTFAGGLTPERQGGGNQSVTLHFIDAAGEGWVFRSIDKYPEQGLPPELNGSFFGDIIADQISALNPGSHFIMPRVLDAAGILHVDPMLYVMPDDARLGEFRETFAGMLGEIEFKANEGPDDTPGFAGSRKIKGTEEFLNDIEESPEFRLDAAEFLRARLVDMWVGDPDRGSDQWRFARFGEEGDYVYRPLPRDRDWAFVRADGFLAARFRNLYPKVIEFDDQYTELEALTYSSHFLDRRLLTGLTRATFEEEAARLQRMLTDDVIREAVADMPAEFVTLVSDELVAELIERRVALPALAMDFYDWLATDVDVRATDERDLATIERGAQGTVRVRLSLDGDATAGGADARPTYYDRTFLPDETEEVRVFLHGDDDRAVVTGTADGPIKVRIIGGGGDDVLEDATGTARFYDNRGDNRFTGGASVDTKSWETPDVPEGFRFGRAWAPDWGGEYSLFSPAVDYGEGAGLIIGGGPSWKTYGFRRLPYRSALAIQALYATRSGGFGVQADGDFRMENSPLALTLDARAVEFDAFRFYGFGNDTPDQPTDETLIMQDRIHVFPALSWHLGERPGQPGAEAEAEEEEEDEEDDDEDGGVQRAFDMYRAEGVQGTFAVGPVLQWTRPRAPEGSPLAGEETGFGQLGGQATFVVAQTDRDAAPRRGFRVRALAAGYPATWDAAEAFGRAEAEVNGYLPLFGETHLAARVGGARIFGEFPAFESAFIGGRHSLRGFRSNRFAGDAAAFGGVELRVPIGTVEFIVNGELGVFGLADAARVWFDGESEGEWHTGVGGGLWFAAFGRGFSAAYAHGERGRVYLWQGLPF